MTETTPALDLVLTTEDIVSITTDVWSSLNLDLEQTAPTLDDADITAAASVSLTGNWDGVVRLEFSADLPGELTAAMFNVEPRDVSNDDVSDAVGELANMLGGNLKSLFPEHSRLSLPSVVLGSDVTLRVSGGTLVRRVDFACGGRALRVTLWEGSHAVADR